MSKISFIFTNVIWHIFKNLCKESFKPFRIERGMLLKQRPRKEKENSTEMAEKWNLGVHMKVTQDPGQLPKQNYLFNSNY